MWLLITAYEKQRQSVGPIISPSSDKYACRSTADSMNHSFATNRAMK
jgi:hypothetical protein